MDAVEVQLEAALVVGVQRGIEAPEVVTEVLRYEPRPTLVSVEKPIEEEVCP
jgi:hypothetical protein